MAVVEFLGKFPHEVEALPIEEFDFIVEWIRMRARAKG